MHLVATRAATWAMFSLVVILCTRASAAECEWGTLKGRFVLDGPAPKARLVGLGVPADDLVVNPQNNGVANVAVVLRRQDDAELAVHPEFENPQVQVTAVSVKLKGFRFVPHTAIMRPGQAVVFANSDPTAHYLNLHSVTDKNRPLQQAMRAGDLAEYRVQQAEAMPLTLECNIYPWMRGYLYAADSPYAAVSDADGNFEIKNLPIGEHEFRLRHDSGWVSKATRDGQAVDWERGVAKFQVKPGKNDLGEILVRF